MSNDMTSSDIYNLYKDNDNVVVEFILHDDIYVDDEPTETNFYCSDEDEFYEFTIKYFVSKEYGCIITSTTCLTSFNIFSKPVH